MIAIDDELAIRDLNARYIDAVNRVDPAAWQATWAEDGLWKIMGQEIRGRAAILEFWKAAMSSFGFAVMALNSGTLAQQGGVASGRWYVTEYLRAKDGSGRMVLGVYHDRYEKRSGEWRFTERAYHALYQGACDLSGAHQPLP